MTQTDTPIAEMAERLSEAQLAMMLRPSGRYQDDPADVSALLAAEVWGTYLTPLGLALRSHLMGGSDRGK